MRGQLSVQNNTHLPRSKLLQVKDSRRKLCQKGTTLKVSTCHVPSDMKIATPRFGNFQDTEDAKGASGNSGLNKVNCQEGTRQALNMLKKCKKLTKEGSRNGALEDYQMMVLGQLQNTNEIA